MQSKKGRKMKAAIKKENLERSKCYIGIDISKDKFDVSIEDPKTKRIKHSTYNNNKTGFTKLGKNLDKKSRFDYYISLESTGSYHIDLLYYLCDKGFNCYLLNPKQVKSYGESMGYNAKTDKIDSRLLLDYLKEKEGKKNRKGKEIVRKFIKPSELKIKLKSYVKLRSDFIVQRIELENKMKSLPEAHKVVKKEYERQVKHLNKVIKKNDEEIKKMILEDKETKEKYKRLTEIKGVGKVVASTVLVMFPELGEASNKEIASLAGLAPHPRQSGTKVMKSRVKRGRRGIKPVLFMASFSAVRYNKILKEFYDRLVGRGKPKKVALVAVMRKMLVAMNAIMKSYIKEKREEEKNNKKIIKVA